MTTDGLNANIRAYRAGSITVKDQTDMVEELVKRQEHREQFKPIFEERLEAFKGAIFELVDND